MSRIIFIITVAAFLLGGCITESRVVTSEFRELAVPEATLLDLSVGAGTLDVIGDPELDRALLDVELRTNRNVLTDDEAAVEALEIILREDGERLVVRVDVVDGPAGYHADVVLRVPSRLAAVAIDSSGDAYFEELASLEVQDESGNLEVHRIAGLVTIEDDSGEILVDTVGSASIHDDSGNLRCMNVQGDVDIVDGSGNVHLERIGGVARVEDGSGDIVAIDVGGLEMISDGSGSVTER
jgi:hypothetical protein